MNKRIDIVFLLLILPGLTFGQNNANVSVGHNQSKSFGHLVEEDLGQALTVNVNPLQSSFNTTKTRVPSPGGRVWVYNSDPGENKSNHILFHSEEAVQSTTDGLKTYNPGFTGEFLLTSTTSSEKSAPTWAVSGEFEEQLDFEIKVVPDDRFPGENEYGELDPNAQDRRQRNYSMLGVGETGVIRLIPNTPNNKWPLGVTIHGIITNGDKLSLNANNGDIYVFETLCFDGISSVNSEKQDVTITFTAKNCNNKTLLAKSITVTVTEPTNIVYELIGSNKMFKELFPSYGNIGENIDRIDLPGPFPLIFPQYRNYFQRLDNSQPGEYSSCMRFKMRLLPEDVSFSNLNVSEGSCVATKSGFFSSFDATHPVTPHHRVDLIRNTNYVIYNSGVIDEDTKYAFDHAYSSIKDHVFQAYYHSQNIRNGTYRWDIPCLYHHNGNSYLYDTAVQNISVFTLEAVQYQLHKKQSLSQRILPLPPAP